MKKQFEFSYKFHETVEAETLREASELFTKKHSVETVLHAFDCSDGKTYEVVGHCEHSGLPIFEHENFDCDENGITNRTKFYEEG